MTICDDRLEVEKAGRFIQVYPHIHALVEDTDNIDNARFDAIEDQMPSCMEAPVAWTEFRSAMAHSRILFQGLKSPPDDRRVLIRLFFTPRLFSVENYIFKVVLGPLRQDETVFRE